MKKFFWSFFAAALGLFIQSEADSQISITTTDLPNYFGVGNSLFIYSSSDTVTMDIGTASTSASQTWTAPPVTIKDSLRTDNVDPSSTPYSADFPGAAYAQKFSLSDSNLTDDTYEYYKVSNDSIIDMGYVEHESGVVDGKTVDTSIVNRNIKLYFHLPTQLGDVFTVSADTTVEVAGLVEISNSVTTVDAYGTVNLARGSFGALRCSTTATSKAYYGSTLLYGSTIYTISWYTKEGYILSVELDSLLSGMVAVHSVTMTYPGKTPATSIRTSLDQPSNFTLAQNYPNPFNPTTTINYELPANVFVALKVYDMLGREVAVLVNQREDAGNYSVRFDGNRLASGIYFYRLEAGSFVSVKKLVVVK